MEVMARRVIDKQPFSPFSEQTFTEINRRLELGQNLPNATAPNVQKALEVLREQELVWKANRGEYALEDSAMAEWLTRA